MAVINSGLGGYTPICDSCGIALCWDISPEEYERLKIFWDHWECQKCNPSWKGQRKRFIENEI